MLKLHRAPCPASVALTLQCPHQGARNLTKAFLPLPMTSLSKFLSVARNAPFPATAVRRQASTTKRIIVPRRTMNRTMNSFRKRLLENMIARGLLAVYIIPDG
eukprot:1192701-Prorocentrum_minimum.AAC.4